MDYFLTIDLVDHRIPAHRRDVEYCDIRSSESGVVCIVPGDDHDALPEPLSACVSRPLSEAFRQSLNRVLGGDVFEARGVVRFWCDQIHEITAIDIFVRAKTFREHMMSRGCVDGDIELSVMARLLHGNEVPFVHAFRNVEFPQGKRVAAHLRRTERLGPAVANGVFEVAESSGWILTHKGMLRRSDEFVTSAPNERRAECPCAVVAGSFDPSVDRQIIQFACARAPSPGPMLYGTARRSRAVLVVTAPSRLVYWQRLLRDQYEVSTVDGDTPDMGVCSASTTDVVLITLQDLRSMSSRTNGPETMLPAAVCTALESRVERVSQYSAEVRLPEFYGGMNESIFRASVVRRFRASSGHDATTYLPAWAITWPYCVVDLPAVISSNVLGTIFWDIHLVRCARMRIVSAGIVCVGDDTDVPQWHMRKSGISRAQELAGYVFGDWAIPLTASVGCATAERTLRIDTPPARLNRVSRRPTIRVRSCDSDSVRIVPARVKILDSPIPGDIPDSLEACPICCTGRVSDVRLACGHDTCHVCLRHLLTMCNDSGRSGGSSDRIKCPFCRAVSDAVVYPLVSRESLEEVLHGEALPRIRDMAVAEAGRRSRRRSSMVVLLENETNKVVRGAKRYLRDALSASGVEVVYIRRADRTASRVRRVRAIWEHLDARKFVVVVAQRKMDLVGVGLPVSLFVVVSGNADPSQLWACTSTPSECVSIRNRLTEQTDE